MNASIEPIVYDGSRSEQYVTGWNDCIAALRSAAPTAETFAASMYGSPAAIAVEAEQSVPCSASIVPGTVNLDPHGIHAYGSVAPEQPDSSILYQHLLDLLGAKDHTDAARIIAGHHLRELERPSAPEVLGWTLVPTTPTEAMLDAVVAAWQERLARKFATGTLLQGGDPRRTFSENYDAMLSAAPPAPRSDDAPREAAHPDDFAVDRFAEAMKAKLAVARSKGRGGWQNDEPDMQQRLSGMLREHVEKGDPRDVANFCMFLHQRGEAILPAREAAQEPVAFVPQRRPGAPFHPNFDAGDFSWMDVSSHDGGDDENWVSVPLYTHPAPQQRFAPDLEQLREHSQAWHSVVKTLDEVAPNWNSGPEKRGMDLACSAIRHLSPQQRKGATSLRRFHPGVQHDPDNSRPPIFTGMVPDEAGEYVHIRDVESFRPAPCVLRPVTDEDVDAAVAAYVRTSGDQGSVEGVHAALENDRARLAGEGA